MSNDKYHEREDRAFEAFIVSQLRRERDISNLDDLPELTEGERLAMNELPGDLVEKLWETFSDIDVSTPGEESCEDVQYEQLAGAGMNRAEDMDEETRMKLAAARKRIAEQIRNKQKGDGDDKP